MKRAALALACALAACGDDVGARDAAPSMDAALEAGANPDGPPPLSAGFTVVGCDALDYPQGKPRCTGTAPLELTFIPVGANLQKFVWTFQGGTPAASTVAEPQVTFEHPGTFAITLVAGDGTGGAVEADGFVLATPGV